MAGIAKVGSIRAKREAFASADDEMLAGMLKMTATQRVDDVELLRKRLYFIESGANELPKFVFTARVVTRRNG